MLKNSTPQQIAIFSSLYIAGLLSVFVLIIQLLDLEAFDSFLFIFAAIFAFITAYFIIIHYLKKYIYRKIKLIYKTIHQHKLSLEGKSQVVDVRSDIIEEVEKEVAQWANDQAEEIENLKSWQDYRRKFLGDIAHELKTPIFNIQGYLETLIDGGLKDKKVNLKYLKKASKNVDRLNTIVEDLDAITRLESGELILEMHHFDILELAKEVYEDIEIKAEKKSIELSFKPGADQAYIVNADRETIRQVLTNLVSNSIKYGKDEGSTKIGFYDMDKYLLIEVADDGIGISEEHLNHVFDRFYRIDKSRSRQMGGSGLGLAIVKHIIEAHKQTVNVRSSETLGSTFGFTLEKA